MNIISRITKFVTVALLALITLPAAAQSQFDYLAAFTQGRNVGQAMFADDGDTALLVKHIGTAASGIIDIAANGDITFKTGAVGAEAVDTSIECDGSIAATGLRSGIIDVSDAACDTILEVMNVVNAQQTAAGRNNWVIVPLDALTSDDLNAGGSGSLVTITGSSASVPDGLALKWDTDTKFISSIALVSPEARKIGFYLSGVGANVRLKPNPFIDTRAILGAANATSTYGSGTSLWAVSQEVPVFKSGAPGQASTATVTVLYGNIAGGATTANKTFIALSDNARIISDVGAKMVVRLTNSAAMASVSNVAYGNLYSVKKSNSAQ